MLQSESATETLATSTILGLGGQSVQFAAVITRIARRIGADPRGGKFFGGLIDEERIHQAALPEPSLWSIACGDRPVESIRLC